MPTTDLDGSAGWAPWLQSLLQNQGAAQPYGASGYPANLPNMPYGPPGGGVLGYAGATPGAPSMGYPAVGQAAGRPSVAPGTQAPGAPNYGPGSQRAALNQTLNPTGPPQAYPPWPTPGVGGSAPPGGPGGAQTGMPFPQDLGPAGRNMPYPGQTDPRGYYAPPPRPLASPATVPPAGSAAGPMDPSIIARQKMAASPAATSTAPPAAAASNPFGTFQYQTPNSSASRAPIYTALNLGGGQPAANPNLPAANAQPVSSGSAPNVPSNAPSNYGPLQKGNNIWDILSKAPWNFGPLQQNNIWSGSGGPGR
jgi:hypothetical protein